MLNMDSRTGYRHATDDEPAPAGDIFEATNRRLSDLDESRAFGEHWTCSRALNASLTLSHDDGTTEDFTDLCSSYGAVNFGHCNEDIRLPAHPGADLVAGIYPPEAEKFARWLTNALDVSDFKVLFQVGGSFAVSTALSLASRNRSGKIFAIEGGFHGLGLDALSRRLALVRLSSRCTDDSENLGARGRAAGSRTGLAITTRRTGVIVPLKINNINEIRPLRLEVRKQYKKLVIKRLIFLSFFLLHLQFSQQLPFETFPQLLLLDFCYQKL